MHPFQRYLNTILEYVSGKEFFDATDAVRVSVTDGPTSANQDALLAELQLKADLTQTQPTQHKDAFNFIGNNTQFGEQRVAEVTRLVGTQFIGSVIDPNFWTATTANSATITQANSEINLASGTNSAGSAQLTSVRKARQIAGVSNSYRAFIQLNNIGIANNTRRWGIGGGATLPTITDGAYFKLSGTTFGVATLKGGVETVVTSGSFNGAASTYTVTTNAVLCEIFYAQSSVIFCINGAIVHTVSGSVTTWSNMINFNIFMDNINSGNTTSVTLESRAASIRRYGKEDSNPQYVRISGNAATYVLKYGAGIVHRLIFNNTSGTSVTIYDNTSAAAPIVALITTASSALGTWSYDLPFNDGLTIVTTGNGLDLTVVYE